MNYIKGDFGVFKFFCIQAKQCHIENETKARKYDDNQAVLP
jgi:hypothetical protein